MKILAMTSGFDGCLYYRQSVPAEYINKSKEHHMRISFVYSYDEINWCDIMVIQKQHQDEVVPYIKYALKIGKPVLYEVDDLYFAIPESNPAHKHYGKDVQKNLKMFYKMVSGITVTTPHLRDQLLPYNDNIAILPNSLDFKALAKIDKMPVDKIRKVPKFINKDKRRLPTDEMFEKLEDKIVVAWGGSPTHLDDLDIITDTLEKIANDNENVAIMMMACCTDKLLKKLGDDKLILVEPVPVYKYHKLLNSLPIDIFLAPIVDCAFNNSKSNLKAIEAMYNKYPIVASNVGEYKSTITDGVDGFLCENTKNSEGIAEDWYNKISTLVNDKNLREQFKSNGFELVSKHYDIEKNIHLWINYYNSFLKK